MKRRLAPYVCRKKYGLPDITMSAIRKYAREVAERFNLDKIILFGSFAYGEPNEHSDVDMLVVMPCANALSQAARIRQAVDAPFPLDLIVRTPERLQQRLRDEDWFLREIMEKGLTLHEKDDQGMAAQGSGRPARRAKAGKRKATHA
jgi:uncharacterized protein